MAIAYRSDTGALTTSSVTGPVGIAFVSTQPSKGDLLVAGGSLTDTAANWNPTVADDVNRGGYSIDVVRGSNAEAMNILSGAAFLASKLNNGVGNPHTVYFDSGKRSNTQFNACGAIAFSSPDPAVPLDVVASASTQNTSQSSQATGTTATTSRDDAVAVIAIAVENSSDLVSLTASGYTVPISQPNGSTGAVGAMAYKILTSKATQSATWDYGAASGGATDDHAACIAVYKGIDPSAVPTYSTSISDDDVLNLPGAPNSAIHDVRSWLDNSRSGILVERWFDDQLDDTAASSGGGFFSRYYYDMIGQSRV